MRIWAVRWYRWFKTRRHVASHGCPFCGSVFLKLSVSIYRHPSRIVHSRITSICGLAECEQCGKKFDIMRIGEGRR